MQPSTQADEHETIVGNIVGGGAHAAGDVPGTPAVSITNTRELGSDVLGEPGGVADVEPVGLGIVNAVGVGTDSLVVKHVVGGQLAAGTVVDTGHGIGGEGEGGESVNGLIFGEDGSLVVNRGGLEVLHADFVGLILRLGRKMNSSSVLNTKLIIQNWFNIS